MEYTSKSFDEKMNDIRTRNLFVNELEEVKNIFQELDNANAPLGEEVVIDSKGRTKS